MATIVTVHGTGATGEAQGSRWWQRGSPCEARLRELVQGSDGEFKYEPLIWDGKNSETSRRAAGRQLLVQLTALEKRGEPYVVIGHSHGGSVISFALQLAARHSQMLLGMRAWITVGTPFIAPEKKRLLYSRADAITRGVFVIGLLIIAALGVRLWAMNSDLLSLSVKLLIALPLAWWFARKLGPWIEGDAPDWQLAGEPVRSSVERSFRHRWLQLWHSDDEAIFLLRDALRLEPRLFPSNFFALPLLTAFIYGLPLIVLAIAANDYLAGTIAHVLATSEPANPVLISTWYANFDVAKASLLDRSIMVVLAVPALLDRLPDVGTEWTGGSLPRAATVGSAMLLVAAALLSLVHLMARGVSIPLSKLLNAVTVSQIRGKFLGADISGERLIGCDAHPAWTQTAMAPLPATLSAEMTRMSDAAAAAALGTIRARARELMAADNVLERLNRYLTWEELVHTTYFNSPLFLLLLAYAIAQADGFIATPLLRDDPRQAQLSGWYAEIAAPGANSSSAQIGDLKAAAAAPK